uniref:Uncharacterized protein n=1 Tax=Scleropages formosus TaxID=113540 RepID=A0A8C9R8M1_SCLFO
MIRDILSVQNLLLTIKFPSKEQLRTLQCLQLYVIHVFFLLVLFSKATSSGYYVVSSAHTPYHRSDLHCYIHYLHWVTHPYISGSRSLYL